MNSRQYMVASNGRQAVLIGSYSSGASSNTYTVYEMLHYSEEKGFTRGNSFSVKSGYAAGTAVSIPENNDTIAYWYYCYFNGSANVYTLYEIDLENGVYMSVASGSTDVPSVNMYIASQRNALVHFAFNNSAHTVQIISQDLSTGALFDSGARAVFSGVSSLYVQDVHQDHVVLVGEGGGVGYVYDYNMVSKTLNLVRKEAAYSRRCWCLYSDTAQKWFLYFGSSDDRHCSVYSWDLNTVTPIAMNTQIAYLPYEYSVKPRLTTAFDVAVEMVLCTGNCTLIFDRETGMPIKAIFAESSLSFQVMSQVANGKTVFLFNNYFTYALDLQTGDMVMLGSIPGYPMTSTGFSGGCKSGPVLVDGGKLLALVKCSSSDLYMNNLPYIAATYDYGRSSVLG